MAYNILSNKKNKSVSIHVAAANSGNVIIAGNSSVSNVATSDEILTGGVITRITYGTDQAGSIQVLRGSTIVLVVSGTGHLNFPEYDCPINVAPTANLAINIIGTANAFAVVEMKKTGTFVSEYFQT